MKYLLLMTLAGSILFVGYCFWVLICGRFLTQNMKYRALTIILLVYLIPWAWLKRIYRSMLKAFTQERASIEITMVTAKIVTEKEDAFWTQDYRKLLLFAGIWLGGAFLFLIGKLIAYFWRRKQLLKVSEKCEDAKAEKLLELLCKQIQMRRKPELFQILAEHDSLTMGAARPVIFLQKDYTGNELELLLRHEMIHIARKDLLNKILLEFVCCLYWCNPIIYLFRWRFQVTCETSCDELVVRNCDLEERGVYAKLLVKNMEETPRRLALENSFAGNKKKAKERVVLIMNGKQRKTWEKAVAACVFAVMLFANSLTALAYPNIYSVEETSEKTAENAVNGEAMWVNNDSQDGYNVDLSIIQYDKQFVGESGNIYPADETSPYVFCLKHSIESGYFQTHVRNSSGGCEVETYKSTRCTNCDTVWVGDWVSTINYNPCPH